MYKVEVSREACGMADDMSDNPLEIMIEISSNSINDLIRLIADSKFLQWSSDSWFTVWSGNTKLGTLYHGYVFEEDAILGMRLKQLSDADGIVRVHFNHRR